MTYVRHGAPALNYSACHYPGLEMAFRGPKRSLCEPYVTFLGGTAFYGRYVTHAIPDRVEAAIGLGCVNLGLMNAGVDAMGAEGMVSLANGGMATVIEVVGAQNLSNQFYRVHPRRNDRMVTPTRLFRQVFPELDLCEVHFTRHLLALMKREAPSRYDTVVEELRSAWVEHMARLLEALKGPSVLLWVVPAPLPGGEPGLDQDPLLVDRASVQAISGLVDRVVEVRETPSITAQGLLGMQIPETESPIASHVPRGALLREAAMALLDPLQELGFGPGRAFVEAGDGLRA
ncbi:DUF6473 family protein [Dinoroseobacter sp. S124A]|uniref:DUF6473 family protein n=1 Tax=Dinoroseobacter sp. S124A TaxID=3415128 RepID=UPI003C79DCA4